MSSLSIAFLVLLFVTTILYYFYTVWYNNGNLVPPVGQLLFSVVLVPSALATAVIFMILITRTDPRELALKAITLISQRTVSFRSAIPSELENTLEAKIVEREDTDGDGFDEWVVYYEYDLQSGRNPVQLVIYDSDRGDPPIIYPYSLRVPDRNYVGEKAGSVSFEMADIVQDTNGPNNSNLSELLVKGTGQLSVFRFNAEQNTEPWQLPSDNPPRYEAIGAFKGSGGVFLDSESSTKNVTVIDRDQYDRSQLALRSVYSLNTVNNTYWEHLPPLDGGNNEQPVLAAPTMTTVDFYQGPPKDIFSTTYPEKIVMAFYVSTCGSTDKSLCRNTGEGWSPKEFLHQDGDAYDAPPSYFGLNSFSGNRQLLIQDIRHYPAVEASSGRASQASIVEITFTVNGAAAPETHSYEMRADQGKWKMLKRIPTNTSISNSNPAVEINTSQ